jgi:methylenetetrahydrofolate--tRNA-(uracil-5-)-methyltransferase
LRYIADPQRKNFQPMNVNFGLLPPLAEPVRGKAKKEIMAQRALLDMEAWVRRSEETEATIRFDACAGVAAVVR